MQGYADSKMQYLSSGIIFDENKVVPVRNRIFYDRILTPSKPAQGGFWGSIYTPEGRYRSDWERFVNEEMYLQKEWTEKIKKTSTIFTLKPDTKLLFLNTFEDLYEEMIPEGNGVHLKKTAVAMRQVKVKNPKFKDYEKQPFVDFEKQQELFDAMAVSKNFVDLVAWCLKVFEVKASILKEQGVLLTDELLNEYVYNEELTIYEIMFAEMFEDWHVESLLVFNPKCVNVIDII